MNKLTKLMLTSAMMITSGFATGESDISGGIEVYGTYNQNENASVAGLIDVKAGGTFNNAATLTFSASGGIEVGAAVEATDNDYVAAYETYCEEKEIADSDKIPAVGTYPPGSVVGVATSGDLYYWYCVTDKKGLNSTDWDYTCDEDGDYYLFNTKMLSSEPEGLPTEFVGCEDNFGETETRPIAVTWSYTPQSQDSYIEEVKKVVGDLSKQAGVFNNASGHLELTSATSSKFSGKISGGQITLTDSAAKFASLVVDGVKANYTYNTSDTYGAPNVGEGGYITVTFTAGKTENEAKADCLDKFAGDSSITSYSLTPVSSGGTDDRKDFPGILADTTLNSTENKLKTADIPTAVKGYKAADGLDVDKAINIRFEGSDNLLFANGGTNKVIEFKGVNTAYEGTASFAGGITDVHANGTNTLPRKLASNMSGITVEITGENTINNGGTVESPVSTTIKSLKVNSEAKLIVAAGTTLTVEGTSA